MTDRSEQQGVPGLCWVGMYLQKALQAEPRAARCCLGWLARKLTELKYIDGTGASAMTTFSKPLGFVAIWDFNERTALP